MKTILPQTFRALFVIARNCKQPGWPLTGERLNRVIHAHNTIYWAKKGKQTIDTHQEPDTHQFSRELG